ncbi:hypothetical protein HN371_18635 [Candidatus Poribacteria bacterium]|nr:hypothetical protein [Candidatus Poribacteria bacterium]MBT5536611.1 hypothetical protein [Candidatus Poribacteria bacterium]MBT7804405.1 hypothetical protein [Candidatus Poribacteria bacterium]
MLDDADGSPTISSVTRLAVVDYLGGSNTAWAGRVTDREFLWRLYDLRDMPSRDSRFSDADRDIHQHTENNLDWGDAWVFYDSRFQLLSGPDDVFLRFLCATLHPEVRSSESEAQDMVEGYNAHLANDGWCLVARGEISGRVLYEPVRLGFRARIFEEPTGWGKVDRQMSEVGRRLQEATTTEQYQGVGLLCRETMISVAQACFDPDLHEPVDSQAPSGTDAVRMLEAYIAAELAGGGNEDVRRQVKAAWKLAVALQHKRTADCRTAALCAEATVSVVNIAAILAKRKA